MAPNEAKLTNRAFASAPMLEFPWSLRPIDVAGTTINGQFDPDVEWGVASPIYDIKDGLAGGEAWLRHTGNRPTIHKFTFHFIAESVFDTRPTDSYEALKELIKSARPGGKPPLVSLQAGEIIVSGYIVEVPEQLPTLTWFKRGLIREVGPITIGIFETVHDAPRSKSTTYHAMQSGETWYEVSVQHYNTWEFAPRLAELNQGARVGDVLSLPPRDSGLLDNGATIAPFFGG